MSRLARLREFAERTPFDLTSPLTHREVVALARRWQPFLWFVGEERFHPIAISRFLGLDRVQPAPLLIEGQKPSGEAAYRPPPAIFARGRVFATGDSLEARFQAPGLGRASEVTNLGGRGVEAATDLFGAPAAQDGRRKPRYPVVVHAEFRMLRECLRTYVAAQLDPQFPREREQLLDPLLGDWWVGDHSHSWQLLEALLAAEDEATERGILADLDDAAMDQSRWEIIRDWGFMEYYFIYAYNDLATHDWGFAADYDHEGDVESCALVFERAAIAAIRGLGAEADRLHYIEHVLQPEFACTTGHNPSNRVDMVRDLRGIEHARRREEINVWVAGGSHASYLIDIGSRNTSANVPDYDELAPELVKWGWMSPATPVVALILFLIDHFWPDDKTSSDGVLVYRDREPAPEQPGDGATTVRGKVETTPLSRDVRIYSDPFPAPDDIQAPLAVRAFPGNWGSGDGAPHWYAKTSRHLDNLANRLKVDGEVEVWQPGTPWER